MRGHLKACVFLGLVGLWGGCSGDKSSSPTDIYPPAVPAGLHVDRAGDGEVALSWTANAERDLAGYRVYRSEDGGQTYPDYENESTPSCLDVGLSYETTYYYKISAYDRNGNESPRSASVYVVPRNTSPPSPPQDLKAIAHHLQIPAVLEITLTWAPNDESDLMGYRIYRSLTEEFQPTDNTLLTDTTEVYYLDEDVEVGKRYHYLVTAYDKEPLESAPSNGASDIPLDTPVLVSPENGAVTHTIPVFAWELVPGAVSYKVIMTTSPVAGEIWIGSATQTHLTYSGDIPLVYGTTYYWKVGTITHVPDDLNSVSQVWSFTAR